MFDNQVVYFIQKKKKYIEFSMAHSQPTYIKSIWQFLGTLFKIHV